MSIIEYRLDRSRRFNEPAKPGIGKQSPPESLLTSQDQPLPGCSQEKPFQLLQEGWWVERRFSSSAGELDEPGSAAATRVTLQLAERGVRDCAKDPACKVFGDGIKYKEWEGGWRQKRGKLHLPMLHNGVFRKVKITG
jgi:hypothetical protein